MASCRMKGFYQFLPIPQKSSTSNQEDKGRFPSYNHIIHPTVYIEIKGLYTLLSRCIAPWNNREVWVDKYCQILYSPIWLRSYFIQ